MAKYLSVLFVTAALLVSSIVPAYAMSSQRYSFAVLNKTGKTIRGIFVSPSMGFDGDESVGSTDTVKSGVSTYVSFDVIEGAKKYNLRVVFTDGDATYYNNVNAANTDWITLKSGGRFSYDFEM